MLRRKPTRLELKLDDIEEFESIRKDLEFCRPEICDLSHWTESHGVSRTMLPPEALGENRFPSLQLRMVAALAGLVAASFSSLPL